VTPVVATPQVAGRAVNVPGVNISNGAPTVTPIIATPNNIRLPGTNFKVPTPNTNVAQPVIPQPNINANVAQARVGQVSVPQPRVGQVAVPQPKVPQVAVPQPKVPQVTGSQQQGRQITTTPAAGKGGMLRQFGGGGGIVTVTTGPQVTATPMVAIVEETGLSFLTKLMYVWKGDQEQVRQLVGLRYADGSEIIDIKRKDVIMEIIGMLQYQEFEDVIDFLTDAPDPEFVLWEQSSLDEGRQKVAREIVIQLAEEVGTKGVGKCRYCPSTELVYAMKQLRSGDEPATVFVRCVMCNKQWRQ
jgi:hypothetical protein